MKTTALKPVDDAKERVADLLSAARELVALLENAKPGDRPWHVQVRARVVEILRLYPVRDARL